MRLASLKTGRDGTLVVVSSDGQRMIDAHTIAPTLQVALDNWSTIEPLLRDLAASIDTDPVAGRPTATAEFAAPLPRAVAWLDGSTFLNHIRLMNRAMGRELKPEMTQMPVMYQGGSDDLLGHRDAILIADDAWGVDLEAELGIVVGDVPMGTVAADAMQYVRLLVLLNDVSLRNLQPRELELGFGMLHAKPSTHFAPFAVTPDRFGDAWSADGKLDITMHSRVNGEPLGHPRSAHGMLFGFAQLVEHAARTRRLTAGTIIGSGTISNEQPVDSARVAEGGLGFSCLSEARAIDMIRTGSTTTPFLRFGDRVEIEAIDQAGRNLFGTINHRLVRYEGAFAERSASGTKAPVG